MTPWTATSSNAKTSRTFISYAWESSDHKDWVLAFATELRRNGVDVILDEWDLPLGGDMYHFMEKSVRTADFVVIVCTPAYAAKANARVGGVGYEARIITTELAQQTEQKKFIPILRQGEFPASAPAWLASRRGLDFTASPYSEAEFQRLLRTLHHEDIEAPPLGPRPNFQNARGAVKPITQHGTTRVGFGEKPLVKRLRTRKQTVEPPKSSRKTVFYQAVSHFGVSADRMTFLKDIDAFGSSVARYSIQNLRSQRDEIVELNWRYRSSSGFVNAPVIVAKGGAGVDWRSDPRPEPETFEDVLRNLCTVQGKFIFDPPLRVGTSRSFEWTLSILNGDALTLWESTSLSTLDERAHVAGKPLSNRTSEFFSQLVWFPTRRMSLSVRLPPFLTLPVESRVDSLKTAAEPFICADDVLSGGSLWAYPQEKKVWERNINTLHPELVATGSTIFTEFAIEYPTVGDYYSLEWSLPELPLGPQNERLKSETEEVRKRLLAHRLEAATSPNAQRSNQISKLLADVHRSAKHITGANDPSFCTALLTWDRIAKRIVTVNVCRNDGNVAQIDRDFWLPFGPGLAGICFRRALDHICYNRDSDEANPEGSQKYVPVPGSPNHEYLLAMAIDHPDWTEEISLEVNAQRCRQLVGILTLGSYSQGSRFGRYCGRHITATEMRQLLDACRQGMKSVSEMLLNESGIRGGYPGEE